jgi:Peptidase family M48
VRQSDARGPEAPNTERAGWRLNLPSTPLHLDDAHLLEYRHPRELPMLCLALAILAVLLAAAVLLKHKAILLGIDLRQRFQVPQTRVFIARQFSLEVETIGFRAPYTIVLPCLLLDSLEAHELRYVLGRELGHIRFGHTRIAILLGGDKSTLPDLLFWIAQVRNIIFSSYRQAQELSADRAGIPASGLRIAIESIGKLSLGNSQVREVRGNDLIDQVFELSRGVNRLQAWVIMLLHSGMPPMIFRVRAMVEWAGLPPPKLGTKSDRGSDQDIKQTVMGNQE